MRQNKFEIYLWADQKTAFLHGIFLGNKVHCGNVTTAWVEESLQNKGGYFEFLLLWIMKVQKNPPRVCRIDKN